MNTPTTQREADERTHQFRKKPVVIEAFQFKQPTSVDDAPEWLTEAVIRNDFLVIDGVAHITTLEGIMTAKPGDWIIRGVKGELYPCKPDIFAATYEPARAATDQPSAKQVDERVAFEAWYAPRHDAVDFTLREDGDQYEDWDIALQWNAWQARASLTPTAPDPVEIVREAVRQLATSPRRDGSSYVEGMVVGANMCLVRLERMLGRESSAALREAVDATSTAPQAASPAEPMYQAQFDSERGSSVWHDVTEAAYHTFMPKHRRIVYLAHQAASQIVLVPDGDDDYSCVRTAPQAASQQPKAVGASDGFGPTKDGCCGVTVTERCVGCPYAPQAATTASAAVKSMQDDDQQFDREAERITREMGLGGGRINPDATSVMDLFIDDEPACASPAQAAQPALPAQPIYQVGTDTGWEDIEKALFDKYKGNSIIRTRVVYLAAPGAAQTIVAREGGAK